MSGGIPKKVSVTFTRSQGYSWFADDDITEFERNFLEYLIGHHKMHGDIAVSWNPSTSTDEHMCGRNAKKFPALRDKRERRYKDLDEALLALGVTVEKPKNSYRWTVPSAAVRQRLEALVASAPKDWIETAAELVEKYGKNFLPVGINLEMELDRVQGSGTTKTQTAATWAAWFRKNRLPALQNSDYYLRGRNRDGNIRDSPPFSGKIVSN